LRHFYQVVHASVFSDLALRLISDTDSLKSPGSPAGISSKETLRKIICPVFHALFASEKFDSSHQKLTFLASSYQPSAFGFQQRILKARHWLTAESSIQKLIISEWTEIYKGVLTSFL
jgi:mRNA deadenylase 3'-5' endonuclease subunit Ccr4